MDPINDGEMIYKDSDDNIYYFSVDQIRNVPCK